MSWARGAASMNSRKLPPPTHPQLSGCQNARCQPPHLMQALVCARCRTQPPLLLRLAAGLCCHDYDREARPCCHVTQRLRDLPPLLRACCVWQVIYYH